MTWWIHCIYIQRGQKWRMSFPQVLSTSIQHFRCKLEVIWIYIGQNTYSTSLLLAMSTPIIINGRFSFPSCSVNRGDWVTTDQVRARDAGSWIGYQWNKKMDPHTGYAFVGFLLYSNDFKFATTKCCILDVEKVLVEITYLPSSCSCPRKRQSIKSWWWRLKTSASLFIERKNWLISINSRLCCSVLCLCMTRVI